MIINKILNNNVVIIINQQGNEVIVSGRGIGYKKKIGDEVDENLVNKIFIPSHHKERVEFETILEEIPIEFLNCTSEIVAMIKEGLNKPVSDSIFLHLSDHIYTAVKRHLDNKFLANALLWDMKRYYREEFKLALQALDIIEKHFEIRLPEDEAGFITFHINNALIGDHDMDLTFKTISLVKEISDIVVSHFENKIDEAGMEYNRFLTHLRFLAQRVFLRDTKPFQDDDSLFTILKERYPKSNLCATKISNYISKHYDYELTKAEKLYLIIHIERLVEHNEYQNKQ